MASDDATSEIPLPAGGRPFPIVQGGSGPSSIISSRMTDIASDDGAEHELDAISSTPQYPYQPSLQHTNDGRSRPGTSTTGVSSTNRSPWMQSPPPGRVQASGIAGRRVGRSGSTSTSLPGRPQSAASRTHVPSLTSHAFFRPMSSQRLQAQRGGSRAPTPGQVGSSDDGSAEGGNSTARQSLQSNQTPRAGPSISEDHEVPPPPSRGTEMTEPETSGRLTSNTSPTYGHHGAGSLSESVRPLQRNNPNAKGLSVNIDKSYKNGGGLPPPSKSPRSFRSSFLLPTRAADAAPNSPNRSTHGREKLSSVATSPALTPRGVPGRIPHKTLGKNYEYFTGNTRFCWGGRMQNTRDRPINIATGLFVLVPGVLFFIFSAPWLWSNISPAIPLVFAYVFYICFSSFIHASVSDPGILPRNLHQMPPPDENEDLLRVGPSTTDWMLVKSASSANAAMEMPVKYCKTCNIWRPPRGHHCRVCDNCIETHDHHCVWLNNCVGRRNYRYFFAFVSFATLMAFVLLGAALAQILVYMDRQDIPFGESINHWRVPFAMAVYSVLAFPYPLALTVYHLFLMGRGETTREYLNSHKFIKSERHRTFTRNNIVMNWIVGLCRPRPPAYLHFKRNYAEGDQRLGERRTKSATSGIKNGRDGGSGLEMQKLGTENAGFQSSTMPRAADEPLSEQQ